MKDHAPSAERNRDAILGVLREVLPARGVILEIASGTGQHAVYFAPHFPDAVWQPSDRKPEALASIRVWAAEAALANLREPIELDVTHHPWPVERADAVVAINMLHISPWAACVGLFRGAARVLPPGGVLYYYGAVFRTDRATAPSNLEFDASLRARDPAWGVRQLADIVATADQAGLALEHDIDMPNNNTSLVFQRR